MIVAIYKKIHNVPSFTFEHLKDSYDKILAKGKSHYKEEKVKRYLVKATGKYLDDGMVDSQLGYLPKEGEEFEVDEYRLPILQGNNLLGSKYVEIVKELK